MNAHPIQPSPKMRIATLAAALLMSLGVTVPATAQDDLTDGQRQGALEFMINNIIFILYHEIGHLYVGEFNLPIIGNSEDTADNIGVVQLLEHEAQDPGNYEDVLIDGVDRYYLKGVQVEVEGIDELAYFTDHGFNMQRAVSGVCLMVGAFPEDFAELANGFEMPPERQSDCQYVFFKAQESLNRLLDPHRIQDEPGAEITIVYEDVGNYGWYANRMYEAQVFEEAAQFITDNFVLPRPISFKAKVCDTANAYYQPSDAAIWFCYELMEDMYNLAVAYYRENPDDEGIIGEDESSGEEEVTEEEVTEEEETTEEEASDEADASEEYEEYEEEDTE